MMAFGGGMVILWLLVIVGVIAVVVGLNGFTARNGQSSGLAVPPPRKETPEDILRARYARGEISQEEYVQMQATLKSS